ncbi:MAG TPA: PASTA domain-containing protein, partial [Humibacillus sp.]|nr:PASTA domain-containing protein [Humibacillus sp.]
DVFLAMELVEGKTLRDVIHEEAPLTAREAIAILEPILLALGAAHAAGLIHRDVKPENVIVRRDGEVKVADFGLARAITNQTTTSQTGVLLGTVSYLSPEQVERGVADQRSDLYAAGLLFFEMLTGRKAVSGDTPIQIAYKHVHGSIDAPSTVVPTVPARLDDLVARATALEPDDRFASAIDFLRALQHVRRALTPAELDRRGTPVGTTAISPVVTTTASLPVVRDHGPTSAYAAPSGPGEGPGQAQRDDADGIPARARQRSSLAGLPVHDDPEVSHTAALPIGRRRTRRRWPWWLVAALLVIGGAAAGWWFTVGPGGMTVVPAVVGQQVSAADTALSQASLSMDENEEFSESAAKGTVLRIEPDPGTELSKDSTVRVYVSKGQERYDVPSLVGTKADDLAGALSPLTLTVGERTTAWSEKVPEGEVISQDPKPGTSVKRGMAVSVVVSKGRQPITVPKVVGADATAASATISKAGLKAVRGDDVNSDTVPTGQVVSQAPSKGTLFRGGTVTIVVSKGPVMVQVPGVVGRPVAEAEKALTDLGFTVQKDYPFGRLFDLVRVQSIEGGQQAPKGSTIILTIV